MGRRDRAETPDFGHNAGMAIHRHVRALLCGLSACCTFATGAAAEPLRIAPLPMENREATVKAFNPLLTHLQQQLGQPVELAYFDKNSAVVAALQNRAIDVALLGPLPYVALRQRGGEAEPLVFFREANGAARYRCVLVMFGGDRTSPRELRGKRIALTQPMSTCGYLGTNAILRELAGITLEETRYRYLDTHEAAALAVVAGEAEAAGVKEEFALKFAPLGLVVVGASDWVPAVGLFASRATLSRERIEEIRRILLATPAEVYGRWGNSLRYGMVAAADADFDSLRRLGDPARIPRRDQDKP